MAYFIVDVGDTLDLSAVYAYYERDPSTGRTKAASGQPAFHPKAMVALVLYARASGRRGDSAEAGQATGHAAGCAKPRR